MGLNEQVLVSASRAGEAYLDVHFYPPFMFQDRDVHICALDCPFVLRNAVHGKCLYDSKGRAYCEALEHAWRLCVIVCGCIVRARLRRDVGASSN